MGQALVGYADELGLLTAALADARGASPRTVLLTGPAGIGKTALLREFLGTVADARVLSVTGEEVETALPYGVLNQLRTEAGAAPVGDVADPLAAGAGFLALLGDLQEGAPVILAVDDAHWSDTPSLHALVFALRRLRVDRILAVLALRDEEAWRLPRGVEKLADGQAGFRMHLNGLTPSQLIELSRTIGAGQLTTGAARRLHEHTGGNPLYATALLSELGSDRLARLGAGPLPAPQSFASTVIARVGALTRATQRLVAAGAVLGGCWPLELAGQVAEVPEPLVPLEEAVKAGVLVEVERTGARSVQFAHPLARAAVYHSIGPAERSVLHTKAAELTEDEAAALRHRAEAAPGPDAGLVRQLAALADSQAAASRWAAAADASLSASRLTTERRAREELLVDAFEFLVSAGDLGHAFMLAEEIEGWDESAGRSYVMGVKAGFAGRLDEARALLAEAWRRCPVEGEPALAARIASMNALWHINMGFGAQALDWAQIALRLDPEGIESTTWSPPALYCMALAAVGHHEEGLRFTSALPDRLPNPDPHEVPHLFGRGILRLFRDALVAARSDLEAVAGTCRRRGPFTFALMGLMYLAETEYRLGQWDDASRHAEVAVSATTDAEWVPGLAFTHSIAAFVPASRGEHDRADEHSRIAAETALDAAQRLWSAVAAARAAQGRGDRLEQVAACERILDLAGRDTVEQPVVQPWRELYVDGLVRLSRLDEAQAVLDELETWVQRREMSSGLSGPSRVRGLLLAAKGDAPGARDAFEAALTAAQAVMRPLATAEVQLDYGAFLRRQGRRRAALEQLLSAHSTLDRLGARPLLGRCEEELAACGVAPVSSAGAPVAHLTPQEQWVARLAATGMTNRDIAAELMLSAKTIEYHLGHIFAKLGVRSRVEMAARLEHTSIPPHDPSSKSPRSRARRPRPDLQD